MKKIIWLLAFILCFFKTIAQQQDTIAYNFSQTLYQVRVNPRDTAFRNTKFLLPPTGFVPDNNAPFKTKAEIDSIVAVINKMQMQIIKQNQKSATK